MTAKELDINYSHHSRSTSRCSVHCRCNCCCTFINFKTHSTHSMTHALQFCNERERERETDRQTDRQIYRQHHVMCNCVMDWCLDSYKVDWLCVRVWAHVWVVEEHLLLYTIWLRGLPHLTPITHLRRCVGVYYTYRRRSLMSRLGRAARVCAHCNRLGSPWERVQVDKARWSSEHPTYQYEYSVTRFFNDWTMHCIALVRIF